MSFILLSSTLTAAPGAFGLVEDSIKGTEISTEIDAPYSAQIRNDIDEQKRKGLLYPTAKFVTEKTVNGNQMTLTTTTVLTYDSPKDSSLKLWDATEIFENIDQFPDDSIVRLGSMEAITEQLFKEQYPEVDFDFDEITREITLVETITVGEPNGKGVISIPNNRGLTLSNEPSVKPFSTTSIPLGDFEIGDPKIKEPKITEKDVLMGFTEDISIIDWRLYDRERACLWGLCVELWEFETRLMWDFSLGFRLPATQIVYTPNTLYYGKDHTFSGTLIPKDFSAQEYENLGISPHEGREAVAETTISVYLDAEIFNKKIVDKKTFELWKFDLIDKCNEYLHDHPDYLEGVKDCGNFVTPIGYDENGKKREFPIPELVLPSDKTGLEVTYYGATIGLGIRADPEFGSDTITANWKTEPDIGSGKITYKSDDLTQYGLGPINAPVEEPSFQENVFDTGASDYTTLTVEDYRFYFDRMLIHLGARLEFSNLLSPIPNTGFFNFATIDLSKLFSSLSLGQHKGSEGIDVLLPYTHQSFKDSSNVSNDRILTPGGTSDTDNNPSLKSFGEIKIFGKPRILTPHPHPSDFIREINDLPLGKISTLSKDKISQFSPEVVNGLKGPVLGKISIDQFSSFPVETTKTFTGAKLGQFKEVVPKITPQIAQRLDAKAISTMPPNSIQELPPVMHSIFKAKLMSSPFGVKGQSMGDGFSTSKLFVAPLQQTKIGINPEHVVCNDDLVLAKLVSSDKPICISENTFDLLLEREIISKNFS